MKNYRLFIALCFLLAGFQAAAHHSFAPHFDPVSSVSITGTITSFEQRNPHSYLRIAVRGENGEIEEFECESSGITQLRRNGIDATILTTGSTVTVTGQQHRRDPHKCFFRTVQVDDGPVLSVSGAGTQLDDAINADGNPDQRGIFGNWLLIPAGDRAGNGESYEEMLAFLTEEGRLAEASYEPIKDDPVYTCHPIGLRRVWFAPGTPTAITREADRIIIKHEWMDVVRNVHLEPVDPDHTRRRNTFGHSVGRIEDGVLTIETDNYPAGLVRQYVGVNNEPPFRGLLHSDQLRTTEIVRYDKDRQTLEVTMLFEDNGYYTREFPPVVTRYERTNLKIRPFGCTPDK